MKKLQKNLLIATSTFPRWRNDKVPVFVLDHAKQMSMVFSSVAVIAPHYKNAKKHECIDMVSVRRFRYFIPESAENIVYEGHATKNINKTPLYALKLIAYSISLFINIILSGRGSIVNAHWLIPQGFLAVLARPFNKARVVVTVHGGDVYTLRGKIMTKIKKFTLRHADSVVVNSSATKAACEELYPNRSYTVIPMGVDIDKIKKANPSLSKTVFTIIFVGRLSAEKGVSYLLGAAKKLKEGKVTDVKFVIVGDGPQKAELEEYVKKNKMVDMVEFLGWIQPNSLPSILKSADIFVGPSIHDSSGWTEAFGLVFVEAAAAGLPVISTNVGGIKDIVEEGKTGFLVDQKSSQQIADKVLKLKNNPDMRRQMSELAIKRSKNFSWQVTRDRYAEIFRSVM